MPFLINNFRGTACAPARYARPCKPKTLGPSPRVRQTHKVFARLRPLIAAAQGEISAAEVSERMRDAALELSISTAKAPVAASVPTPEPPAANVPPVIP